MLNITEIAHQYPEYAMGIAFALALVESLPFIGSLIPGMLTMPAIGWLMAQHKIPPFLTFILIIIGAMIGDYIGYYLGFLCRRTAYQRAESYHKTHWLEAGKSFVKKYGALSIVIGRFIGPFRSSIPLFAGIFSMHIIPFSLAALPSVLLWAVIHLAPGAMLVWVNFDILKHTHFLINSGLMFVTILLVCATAIAKSILKLPSLSYTLNKLCGKNHIHRENTKTRVFQTLCVLSACICNSLLIQRGGYHDINITIYQFFSQQSSLMIQISLLQNALCYIPLTLVLTCLISSYLIYTQKTRQAAAFSISVGTTFIICFLIKYTINHPRPEHIAAFLGNQSLPSGHTSLATAFLLTALHQGRKSTASHMITYLFIIITMTTRVLIGAHWFSDVVFGWMIGYLGFLIGQIIINRLHIATIQDVANKYLGLTATMTNAGSIVSHSSIITGYCMIAWLLAYMTNKLSIAPYLLTP